LLFTHRSAQFFFLFYKRAL